jgi:hypothetical protein
MIYHTLERFSSYKKKTKKLPECDIYSDGTKTLRRLTCNTTGVIKR